MTLSKGVNQGMRRRTSQKVTGSYNNYKDKIREGVWKVTCDIHTQGIASLSTGAQAGQRLVEKRVCLSEGWICPGEPGNIMEE